MKHRDDDMLLYQCRSVWYVAVMRPHEAPPGLLLLDGHGVRPEVVPGCILHAGLSNGETRCVCGKPVRPLAVISFQMASGHGRLLSLPLGGGRVMGLSDRVCRASGGWRWPAQDVCGQPVMIGCYG